MDNYAFVIGFRRCPAAGCKLRQKKIKKLKKKLKKKEFT